MGALSPERVPYELLTPAERESLWRWRVARWRHAAASRAAEEGTLPGATAGEAAAAPPPPPPVGIACKLKPHHGRRGAARAAKGGTGHWQKSLDRRVGPAALPAGRTDAIF
ncbi:MAG: hypothetical protein WC789_12415 [Lentisphaeria bacterium]